jgi:hypothetical protein
MNFFFLLVQGHDSTDRIEGFGERVGSSDKGTIGVGSNDKYVCGRAIILILTKMMISCQKEKRTYN